MSRIMMFLGLTVGAICLGLLLWFQQSPSISQRPNFLRLADLDSLPTEGFRSVENGWDFQFPRDHAAHPGFRSEAWTLSATLEDQHGQPWGLQFSLLRLALSPDRPEHPSAWASNAVYRAALVVGDSHGDYLLAEERLSRVALDLAGSDEQPPRVWLENWSLQSTGEGLALEAATGELSVDLQLLPRKAPLLRPAQGEGAGAFHAYALSRIAVSGALEIQGETHTVAGLAWLDRAWGAVPVSRGQQALDRFLIQLDDHRELAIFRLHRLGGGGTPIATALLIDGDGSVREYGRLDLTLEPRRFWESPLDGARYPVAWSLELPAESLSLELQPLRDDQELDMMLRYWAGSLRVSGEARGRPVSGVGYLELTGYAHRRAQTL